MFGRKKVATIDGPLTHEKLRTWLIDELASMVLECLTNSYMNGETVRVDGGIRMPPK